MVASPRKPDWRVSTPDDYRPASEEIIIHARKSSKPLDVVSNDALTLDSDACTNRISDAEPTSKPSTATAQQNSRKHRLQESGEISPLPTVANYRMLNQWTMVPATVPVNTQTEEVRVAKSKGRDLIGNDVTAGRPPGAIEAALALMQLSHGLTARALTLVDLLREEHHTKHAPGAQVQRRDEDRVFFSKASLPA